MTTLQAMTASVGPCICVFVSCLDEVVCCSIWQVWQVSMAGDQYVAVSEHGKTILEGLLLWTVSGIVAGAAVRLEVRQAVEYSSNTICSQCGCMQVGLG